MSGLRKDVRVDPLDPGPQPAGRSPAPGRLGAAQAFGNAFWDVAAGGRDAWSDVDGYRAWLSARGWDCRAVGETERLQALDVREALRGLARRNHEGLPPTGPALRVLDAAACRAPVVVRFDPAPRHQPVGDGHEGALGLVLGIVAEAMADGTWSRLKACPGPHCGWMFWDGSRNRSSQWCSMRVCGNRVKGQAFRARRRGAAPA
jgi:predicted RNA-binding Zn ribbon-like protein